MKRLHFSARLLLSALSVFAALELGSCGGSGPTDDDTDDEGSGGDTSGGRKGSGGKTGSGGKKGSGGKTGSGGKKGSGGMGGDPNGSGGASSDGGTSTGGKKSSGGSGPTGECGDGVVDAIEQCDGGDECSESCGLVACDECREENGGGPVGGWLDCDGGDFSSAEKRVCEEVLACYRANDCSKTDVRDCYCGDTPDLTCWLFDTAAPVGPCKEILEEAAGTDVPLQIGTIFFDRTHPVGFASVTVYTETGLCQEECGIEGEGTGGSPGTGGAPGTGGGTGGDSSTGGMGGNPSSGGSSSGGSGNEYASCEECTGALCGIVAAEKETRCAAGGCDDYLACVDNSNCAASDVRDCYCGSTPYTQCFLFDASAPAGACKEIINQMAGTTSPIGVGTMFFDAPNQLSAVNNELVCQATKCQAECF